MAKLVAAARELRDRYLEHVNAGSGVPASQGKYDVSRSLSPADVARALPAAPPAAALLPAA